MKKAHLLALAMCAQLILPYPLFAHALRMPPQAQSAATVSSPSVASNAGPINLDLSSVVATTRASVLDLTRSLSINVGGKSLVVGQSTVLTPAELVAAYQVSASGVQALSLSAAGNASGGRFSLSGLLLQSIGNLVIPQHVKLVQNFGAMPVLDISGNLINDGKLIAFSTNPLSTSAAIDATNIYNQQGALVTSVLPAHFSYAVTPVSSLTLTLSALGDIVNAGEIAGSGNLSVSAGGTITNSLPSGASGRVPTIQAANNVNLLSANLVNSGMVSSLAGNINISSAKVPSLMVNSTGGTISALAGNINVLNSFAAPSSAPVASEIVLIGGNYLSQSLNIDTGTGKLSANIGQVSGWVNINAASSSFGAATGNLKLGNLNVTGDPTYFNAAGSLTLSNIAPTDGYDLALLAEGDVIVTGGAINTVEQGSGSGGNITIIAGANITAANNFPSGSNDTTTVVTVNGPSATGGAIDLSGASIIDAHAPYGVSGVKGSGGNILLVAYSGSGQGSTYVPGTINAGTAGGMASYTQAPSGGNYSDGDITIIAGATQVPNGQSAVVLNSVHGINAGSGMINIYEATPTGQITVQNGTIMTGAITPGALQAVSLGTAAAPVVSNFTGQLRLFTAGSVYINSNNVLNLGTSIFGSVFQITNSGPVNIVGNLVGTNSNNLVSITSNLYASGGTPPTPSAGISQSGQTYISAANITLSSYGDVASAFNASGNVLIDSQGSVTLQSSAAGGTLQVSAGKNLSILGSLSAGTSLSLVSGLSGASTIQIAPSANIQSGGNLSIQNNDTNTGSIIVGNGASLLASGQISIVIGNSLTPVSGTAPTSVTVNELNGGQVFFGSQGIVAAEPQNTITADTNNVVFNVNSTSLTSAAISLGGGVLINSNSAGSNSYGCACGVVLTSLDLSNPSVVSQIVQLQQSDPSQVGGTLIVTNGVATGGNLILSAAVNLANLSAEVIPANVTVQFSGFKINPINVNITGASSTQQVVINGTAQFVNSSAASNALMTITNTQGGNALGVNGSLTSDGSLNLNAQGSIATSGAITASGSNMSITMTRGSLRVPFITAENPLIPSGLIQTGGIVSAANEIEITGDEIAQTTGSVTAATVNIQVTGNVGAQNMPVSVSANNLSVNAGGLYVFLTNPSGGTNLQASSSADYFVLSSFGTITVSGNLQALQTQLIALPGSNGSILINNAIGAIGGSTPQWVPTLALAADGSGSIVLSQANLLQVTILSLTTGTAGIGSSTNYFTTSVSNLTVNSEGNVFISNTVPTSIFLNPTGNPGCDIASASVLGNLTITNDQILDIAGPVYVGGALNLSSGEVGTGNTAGSPIYISASSVDLQAVLGAKSQTFVGVSIASATTINSAGALTIQSNDTNSGYIRIDSGATLFSNGPTIFTIGDLPVSPVKGNVPKNVTAKQLNGGQVYFGTEGITASAPTNTVTADTNSIIFNMDRANASSFPSITFGGGDIIDSHAGSPVIVTQPLSFASLDLTDPVVANQIVRLQQNNLLGGTLILLAGYAIGGTVVIPSAIDLSNLSAFNIPANVGVTFQNFQANNPININSTVQAPPNLETINGQIFFQGVENFVSTHGPSNVVINVSSLNESSPALYLTGNLTSDGSVTISVNGGIQASGITSVAGNLTLKTVSGSNGAIALYGIQSSGGTTTLSADGSGAISQANLGTGTIGINIVSGSTVSLNSVNGAIGATINGGSEGGAINVSAGNLIVSTYNGFAFLNVVGNTNLTVSSTGGSATVNSTGSVNLNSSTVAGNLSVTAANNISVSGNVSTASGALTLSAGNSGPGNIQIAPLSSLVSTGGALTLQDNDTVTGAISIGSGSSLFANGQIAIVIGDVPVLPVSGSAPANVSVNQSLGGGVFFGLSGITANGAQNNVTAKFSNAIFNSGNLPASAINLGGNVAITASYPLINTLELDGWQTEGLIIQKLQAQGLLGGTLTLISTPSSGVIAQGSIVITPNMLTPMIGGIVISSGLTITFNGFTENDPINVGSPTTGSEAQVSIAGTLQFIGASAYGVINMVQNVFDGVVVTGSLSSTGSLTVNSSVGFSNYGQIAVPGNLIINMAGRFENGGFSGPITASISAQSITINATSSQPLYIFGQGLMASTAGTTISAPGGTIIGLDALSMAQQTISGAATLITTQVKIAPGSYIHAHPFVIVGTPLTSLDLTDPATVSEILTEQNSHLLGGKLIVNQGVATGGTLVLQPDNLAGSISAEDIPNGVTVTFNNFQSNNAINIVIGANSTNEQVVINGQESFTKEVALNITSDQNGPVFVEGSSGVIRTNGSLAVSANGDMIIGGSLIGGYALATTGSGSVALNANVGSAGSPFSIALNGTGSLSQESGKTIAASTVTLVSNGGDIGTSNAPIQVKAASLAVNAGAGDVFVKTMSAAKLYASSGDSFNVIAGGNLMVVGAIVADNIDLAGAIGTNAGINLAANVGESGGTTTIAAAGFGDIAQTSGQISGADVSLASLTGSIGSIGKSIASAASSSLTLDTGGSGSIYDSNNQSVTLDNSQVGASLSVFASGGLTVNNVTAGSGSIVLAANGGLLQVNSGVQILANRGSITVENSIGGTLVIGSGASIHSSAVSGTGVVNVLIGPLPKVPARGSVPENVVTSTQSRGVVYFGSNGITASSHNNFVNANGCNVIFSTGSSGASAIDLQGNVTITAGKNQPVNYTESLLSESSNELVVDTGEVMAEDDLRAAAL